MIQLNFKHIIWIENMTASDCNFIPSPPK